MHYGREALVAGVGCVQCLISLRFRVEASPRLVQQRTDRNAAKTDKTVDRQKTRPQLHRTDIKSWGKIRQKKRVPNLAGLSHPRPRRPTTKRTCGRDIMRWNDSSTVCLLLFGFRVNTLQVEHMCFLIDCPRDKTFDPRFNPHQQCASLGAIL